MKYKIIVDKQSREKPSNKKKEYLIDIEELRVKNNIYDSLVITKEEAYVIRRLNLSDLHVLTMLKKEVKEPLEDLSIELFEGENYIYLLDMTGNKFYAEYIVKNEFTDMYVTNTEMNSAINQTANSIDLAVNQKLTSYSTIEELIKAKEEAIDTTNSNTTNKLKNYSTTVEMNSAINMKANEITSTVSETYSTKTETNAAKEEAINSANNNTKDKLKDYSTTTQMNSKIEQTAKEINSIVSKKIGEDELGTKIEQNWEHVKYAWNQISEFIQMEILNGNASLAFKKDSNNLLMALDKLGQHFYDSDGKVFGEIGVKAIDNQNYMAFSVPSDYNSEIADGMAWGITTPSDGEFHPILFIKNFGIGHKESDDIYGQLELANCDLILGGNYELGNGGSIILGNLTMTSNMQNGLSFINDEGKYLFSIYKGDESPLAPYDTIKILDNIEFYKNQAGSNSLKIGNDNTNYCLMTDEGSMHCHSLYLTGKGEISGNIFFYSIPTYQGNKLVYGDNGHKYFLNWTGSELKFWVDETNVGTLSDKRLKTDIGEIDNDFIQAIKEIEMKQFKVANRNGLISFGILAQDLIKIFKKYNKNPFDYEIVQKTQYRTDDNTIYYTVNYEQFLVLKTKVQEQEIKQLQEKDKQKEDLIQSLIRRIEKLEVQDEKN